MAAGGISMKANIDLHIEIEKGEQPLAVVFRFSHNDEG